MGMLEKAWFCMKNLILAQPWKKKALENAFFFRLRPKASMKISRFYEN
jgi:hypothetical protein